MKLSILRNALLVSALALLSACASHTANLGYGWKDGTVTMVNDSQGDSRFNYSNELHTNGDKQWQHWEQLGVDSNVGLRYARDVKTTKPLPPQNNTGDTSSFELLVNLDNGDAVTITQRYYAQERFYEGQRVQVFMHGNDLAATGTEK